ncbi:Ubiquitin-like-conjugating enzyme ATG10 [Acropora cervicornis]|uniref:Ubiquitin-like-conjugating enzyme ATG10 n=1 Tax=Acropora cervicornis TaxID=6130 RepID=A0AAD9VCW4_ACRCE|nr:Ubiquitin-like-conjugating enzyme ATG10 [Acropora cervicornis]
MCKSGTLSREEFEKEVDDFLETAKNAKDSWHVEFSQGKRRAKYLVKHDFKLRNHTVTEDDVARQSIEDKNWGLKAEDDNDSCALSVNHSSNVNEEFIKYEYHIVYSHSYGVPVLYFTASQQDGKLVNLEEIWKSVPEVYRKRLEYEKWTFLTQQEHPYLCVPFYQLHPCHTADMMKAAFTATADRPVNYLVTWLSSVGPVIGLNLSNAYSM